MVDVNLETIEQMLNRVAEIDNAVDMLKQALFNLQHGTKTQIPTTPAKTGGIEDNFGVLTPLLNFTEGVTFTTIKAKRFLERDDFSQIAQIVKGLGGKYVSAGKDSHFEIPKKA
jgi:hypothetical protein